MLFGTQQIHAFPDQSLTVCSAFGMAQRPRRRPLRRCAALRQHAGHRQARRRAGRCRRRPRRPFVNLSAPDRAHLRRCDDTRAEPQLGAGHHRFRPRRLRPVALLRAVGRAEDHRRDRRAGRDDPDSSQRIFATPAFAVLLARLQHRPHVALLPRRPRRTRTPRGAGTPARPRWPGPAPTAWTAWSSADPDAPIGLVTVGRAHHDTQRALRARSAWWATRNSPSTRSA